MAIRSKRADGLVRYICACGETSEPRVYDPTFKLYCECGNRMEPCSEDIEDVVIGTWDSKAGTSPWFADPTEGIINPKDR